MTETLLWENTTPTNNFAQQTFVQIADTPSYKTFDYIKFIFCKSKSIQTSTSAIFPVSDFWVRTGDNTGFTSNRNVIATLINNTNSTVYTRTVYGDDKSPATVDRSIFISTAYQSGGSGTNSGYIIPLYIYGLK